ncbi:hypothetical protein FOA52_015732 [Chlamydomonas sp. UWO 241]|nr:hypothetical protein FOA52_015732 [Chlamydomonas sp. UWO 241]
MTASISSNLRMIISGVCERFVDDCVLELQGGAATVRLTQAPSTTASTRQAGRGNGGGGNGGGSGPARGVRRCGVGPSGESDRESDPALTGTTVWDGGVILSHVLTSSDMLSRHMSGAQWPSRCGRPHCVELGAGTGAVGLSLAACHMVASSTITDIPSMLPHIEANVKRNSDAIRTGPWLTCGPRHHHHRPAHHTSAPPPPPAVYVRPLRWGPPGEDIDSVEREAAAGQRVQREQVCTL